VNPILIEPENPRLTIQPFLIPAAVHCGENSRIFQDAADLMLPVTNYSKIKGKSISVIYLGIVNYRHWWAKLQSLRSSVG
jgi:hypothetical protein